MRSKTEVCSVLPKENYFLCASRISEEKGHERIIKIFAKFASVHENYRLVILGEGYESYVNKCKLLVESLGIQDKVSFEGFKTNVDEYMMKAKALLVASQSEGFGRMTAEAAFNCCLVIGYNNAGTKEILENTGGFLWSDDTEFLSAMETVVNLSDEEYEIISRNAQTAAVKSYSKEAYISKVLRVYNVVLKHE